MKRLLRCGSAPANPFLMKGGMCAGSNQKVISKTGICPAEKEMRK